MLLCRLAIATLRHRHNHFVSPAICTSKRTWLPARRNYSNASGGDQQGEELDISKISAESAYLDLLLGPADSSSALSVQKKSKTAAETGGTSPSISQRIRNARTSLSPRQLRREQVKLAAQTARRRRAPLTFYETDKPQRTADDLPYDAETRGKVQEVSQWRLGADGREGPTISVKRIVPAIAPVRTPPQTSGVEYRELELESYQRFNAAYRDRAMTLAAARTRRAERHERYVERRAAQARNIEYRKLNIAPHQRPNPFRHDRGRRSTIEKSQIQELQMRKAQRMPPQSNGVEYRKLKIEAHQRCTPIEQSPAEQTVTKRSRRAAMQKREEQRDPVPTFRNACAQDSATKQGGRTLETRIGPSGRTVERLIVADPVTLAELSRRAGNEVVQPAGADDNEHSKALLNSRTATPRARSQNSSTQLTARPLKLSPHLRPTQQNSMVRTASVLTLRPSIVSQMQEWNKKLAALWSSFDKRSPRCGEAVLLPALHPDAGAWATSALNGRSKLRQSNTVTDMPWINMGQNLYWQQAALWLLFHDAERVADFLTITNQHGNAEFVADILQHLADRFTLSQDTAGPENLAALADAFPQLADRGTRRPLMFKSSFFRLLMPHCSNEQINELYRAAKVHRVETSWSTWLHFATYLAKGGQFEQALEAITESSRAGAEHDSSAFRSTCATLLRAAIREPSGLRVCLRVVDHFAKLGVTLNIQLCNIVILNAVEAGDQRTALAVYNSLVEHGLQADAYTYAILLKGCKSAIDDADGLNTIIRHAIEHVGVAHEPIVATEIIHCLALHHNKHHPDRAFDTVADAYAQLFDLDSLRKLGIVSSHLSARIRPREARMQPPDHVVHIMIAAHLEHTFRQTRSTADAYQLYRRFLELSDAGVQPFRGLLETDYAANAFMMTFGKTKKGLLHAAEVIRDMQRKSRKCCRPTVQTWTIFLHSFTRHGHMKLAEQVLSYMKSKGMSPNQVTWNVLTAGYATAQDVDGTLQALRRMEEDGKVWDEWTEGGLKRLKDQRAMMQLAQSQYTRRLQKDVDADLKEGLRDRISSVEQGQVEERQRDEWMADSPGDLAEDEEAVSNVYKPL